MISLISLGVVHADFNEQNILVEQEMTSSGVVTSRISAVIDFGDALDSFYVFEIATTIMYMMDNANIDSLMTGGHVLAGYLSEHDLNALELGALKSCVCARFVQSLVLGAYTYSLDPNNDYVLGTTTNGWSLLSRLYSTPKNEICDMWNDIRNDYLK